jgi:tetratricopeptide (TPR) repeat protein
MENNEPDGALLAYQTALEMDSENGDVCAKAARASRKSGNLEGGIKYLQKAIYLSSNMSPLLKEMGDIYGLLGNKRAARFCYEKSQSVIL